MPLYKPKFSDRSQASSDGQGAAPGGGGACCSNAAAEARAEAEAEMAELLVCLGQEEARGERMKQRLLELGEVRIPIIEKSATHA